MPFFSVIIPTHNRRRFLREAIDSVLVQSEQDFELVVVDDGSTDETVTMLRECYEGRLIVVEQLNQGPSAARNTGARHASGEYLAFLDSDDLWMPWTLATYREVVEKHWHPDIVTSVPLKCGIDFSGPLESPGDRQFTAFGDYYSSCGQHRRFGSGVTLVRRDRFLKSQGFDEEFLNTEDLDFMLRLGASGGFVEITHPHLVAWRQHNQNLTENLSSTGEGLLRIIDRELGGQYPGGSARQAQRRRIISRHVRSHSLARLRQGQWRQAWRFYQQIIRWNLRERRIRYIFGFPLFAVAAAVRIRL